MSSSSQPNKDSCCHGPGYASPKDAIRNGPREKLLYVPCVSLSPDKPDSLATIDVDPQSKTYSKVIHRLWMSYVGDEVHHSGWNSCSSCYDKATEKRSHLVLPCLNSSRVYVVDTLTDERQPRIAKVIEPEEVFSKGGISMPHTAHCLASGDVMLSSVGDENGNPKGSFILIDAKEWKVKGRWEKESVEMGHDFWYKPRHNFMISTELGEPRSVKLGFNPERVKQGLDKIGRFIRIWDWTKRELIQTMELGPDGQLPSEVRMLHDPDEAIAYVNCGLSSTVWTVSKAKDGSWKAEKVITVESKKVDNWLLPEMPGLILDQLISLDDRFLYLSNWAHGDIRQYDITDRHKPKLVGQVFIGGLICKDSPVKVIEDRELKEQPDPLYFGGKRVQGGAQQLMLSLDGKRLYVTTSLYSGWDKQFYPEMVEKGAWMLLVDVNTEGGGLTLNKEFFVDFGAFSDGPTLANLPRFPGGDCKSDIWL